MSSKLREHLKLLVHPYIFVLKEGHGIGKKEDLIDYSLLMLQVSNQEVLYSPSKQPIDPLSWPPSIPPYL